MYSSYVGVAHPGRDDARRPGGIGHESATLGPVFRPKRLREVTSRSRAPSVDLGVARIGEARILGAVRIGDVRLIDNLALG